MDAESDVDMHSIMDKQQHNTYMVSAMARALSTDSRPSITIREIMIGRASAMAAADGIGILGKC